MKHPISFTNTGLVQLAGHADGAPAELEPGMINNQQSTHKYAELNEALLLKERQLIALKTEVQTLHRIVDSDYQQTLKFLYTTLEYVITAESRHVSDTSKGCLRRAQSAIQRMQLLTQDIVTCLAIGIDEGNPQLVDLNELLAKVLHDLSGKTGPVNALIEVGTLPVVSGYPLLLSMLFYHLLDNAIKFRMPQAPPQVSVSYKGTYPETTGNLPEHACYKIVVADKGIGFLQEEHENLFNMFYRLHDKKQYRGSGIGLTLCKKIMNVHHGIVTAESVPLKGASFSCYFPHA